MPSPTFYRLVATVAGKFPLRTILIVPFVLQIVGTVGLVGYLSYRNGQQAVNKLASQLMNEVSSRIDLHLDSYLALPHQINQINLDAVETGLLDLQNFSRVGTYFWKQMRVWDVGYISYGNTKGEFIGVERLNNGNLLINEVSQQSGLGKLHIYQTDNRGNRTNLLQVKDWEPRGEAWYTEPMKTGKSMWSGVYQWEDKPEVLSISSSYPVYAQNKQIVGILSIDLILSQLNYFLKDLKVGKSGKTFILERNGLLVASSSPEQPFKVINGKASRLSGLESQDSLIRFTVEHLQKHFGSLQNIQGSQQFEQTMAGLRQFVQVTTFSDQFGLDWLIVIVVPESDFMEEINANTHISITLCIVAAIGAIIMGVLTAHWVTKPLLQLNIAARNIAQGAWEKAVTVERNDEIGELTTSFNDMAAQLQNSFAALQQSESRLKQFLEAIPVGVTVHDMTGKLTYANQAAKQLLDIDSFPEATTEHLSGAYQIYRAGTQQLYPTQELPAVRALEGERIFLEDLEIHFSNRIAPYEAWATPIYNEMGEIVAAIVAFQDITQRKQSETLLTEYNRTLEAQVNERTAELTRVNDQLKREITEHKQTEASLYDAQRIAHIGSWEIDIATSTTTWSEELYRIYGIDPTEPPIKLIDFLDYIHPDDRECYRKTVEEKILTGKPFKADLWIIRQDKSMRYLEVTGEPEFNHQGQYIRMFGTVLDISDRKQAEDALRESVERERAISRTLERMRQTLDIRTIFDATTSELRQTLKCDRVAIYQFHPDWSGKFVAESVADNWVKLVSNNASNTITKLVVDTYQQDATNGIYNQTNYLAI
ncbi:MAG TPA: PAS domain S-box protein, partial [Cyanophyceae cyanobacterium]